MFKFFISKIALLTFILLYALPASQLNVLNSINGLSPRNQNAEMILSDPESLCPVAEDIFPCQCVKDCEKCMAFIECANITSLNILNDVFHKSGDFPFRSAIFKNMSIPYFPSYSLLSKQYRSLDILDSVQISLFDEPPASNSLLEQIYLKNIKLQRSIEWNLFSAFQHLFSIEIVGVPLKKIKNFVGESLPNQIREIKLSKTQTTSLGDNAFEPMKQLRYLEVSKSTLSIIKRSMFPRPFMAPMINLSGNKIASLPDDIFSDMPDLTTLELSNNLLTTFSKYVYENLPQKPKSLILRGNPIVCDCSLKWITQQPMIYLSGQCSAPTSNKGKILSTLNSNDFAYC